MERRDARRPLRWIGSARKDLLALPDEARSEIGFALHLAQVGSRHVHAKPLKGFGGSGVREVIQDHDGDTFRAVYAVRFADVVYVLHVFQKKSTQGIATSKHDLALIRARLRRAEEDHEQIHRDHA